MTAPGTTTEGADRPALRRAIGPKLMVLFVVGDILGTGIYATTGKVAGKVGGALWLPFAIGFAAALLTAASYVELVGKYPRAAGAALYTQKAFKVPFLTFVVAFMVVCSGLSSAAAAARAFSGDYLGEFNHVVPPTLVAVLFVLALAALNLRGVSESVKTNVVFTLVELSGLLIVLGIGVYSVLAGEGTPSRLGDLETTGGTTFAAVTGVLGATALAFFAFIGFEDSVNMAEETKDPARTFPRAIFLGVGFTGTLYILVALVSSLLVDHRTLERSSGPLLEVVKAGGVDFPPRLFAVIALFAVANSALINMMMASRLCYGLGNEGILPRAMCRVLPQRRTPVVAVVFVALLALGLVVTGGVEGLGDTTAFLLLCVFVVVNVSVLVLRRDPVGHPHFRAPTIVPVLGAVTALVLASPLAERAAEVYVRAGVLVAIGVALWGVNRAAMSGRRGRRTAGGA